MHWDSRRWTRSSHRLSDYLAPLLAQLGRSERREAATSYIRGLLAPGLKKMLEPMAQATGLDSQRLQQFLSDSPWDEAQLWSGLKDVAGRLLGTPAAWILYESSRPKQGAHSVGVSMQQGSGRRRESNCQVAIELLLSDGYAAAPVGGRLYLPKSWCQDAPRMRRAQVPESVAYLGKPDIALRLIEDALVHGLARAPIVGDETYGNSGMFRERLELLGLQYTLGIGHQVAGSAAGTGDARVSLLSLAQSIPKSDRHLVSWEDHKGRLRRTQLAWSRVRLDSAAGPVRELWLLADWVDDAAEPMRLFVTNLPCLDEHRALQMARGRQLVSDHFDKINVQMGFHQLEARSWRAFHHHLALSGVALSFVLTERLRHQKALSVFAESSESAAPPVPGDAERMRQPRTAEPARNRRAAVHEAPSKLQMGASS